MKTIQSIDRAIMVLDYIAKRNGTLSLTDLSHSLEIKITTMHGILATLEYQKLLYKNPKNGKYYLGVKLFELGKIYESDFSIVDSVHPYLEKLSAEFGETVHLAVPFENEILYIDKVESTHKIRLTSMVGTTEKALLSALGLVILAYLPEMLLDKFIENCDNHANEYKTRTQLAELFQQVRNDGYYLQFEMQNDCYCIAVPLLDSKSLIIGAVSIVVPKHRYNKKLSNEIIKQLKQLTAEISPLI